MEEEAKITQKPKRIILDIGMGRLPFVAGWKQRKLLENEIYVGVEPEEDISVAAHLVQEPRAVGEGKAFVLPARGERLPFGDRTADEVVVSNLIGHKHGPHAIPREIISSIITEVGRVLNTNGKVVIVETMTPAPRQDVVDLLERNDFVLSREVKLLDGETAEKEIEKFHNLPVEGSYLMEFVKRPK